jgi:hypothetical protein
VPFSRYLVVMDRDGTQRERWAVALLLAVSLAGCSTDEPQHCFTDIECGYGNVCGQESCSSPMVCMPAPGCLCFQNAQAQSSQLLCPSTTAPRCHCADATCAEPYDSCGEHICLDVCELGDPCEFCRGSHCELTDPCRAGRCLRDGPGEPVCLPETCHFRPLRPPLCGSPDSICGEVCDEQDCEGIECGPDRVLGESCGTCGPNSYCAVDHCQQTAAYLACDGELQATPPEVPIGLTTEPLPEPRGGDIADGIYDLVAQIESRPFTPSTTYVRGALRFSDGATRVEHIFDPTPEPLAHYDSLHRNMIVSASGPILSFLVACPDNNLTFDPEYVRGFTASGTELHLFQEEMVEIYTRRP